MKVIVLGNGNAGRYIHKFLSQSLFNCYIFSRKNFDATVTDFNFLTSILKPGDVVINCVGILKPKIKEVGVEKHIMLILFIYVLTAFSKVIKVITVKMIKQMQQMYMHYLKN
jgi:glutamyl-tRNA reductase